jgi:hypothetical protein
MLGSLGLDSPEGMVLSVLATGAGAMVVSHANDSYFWVVSQLSRIPVATAYRTLSVATAIEGIHANLGELLPRLRDAAGLAHHRRRTVVCLESLLQPVDLALRLELVEPEVLLECLVLRRPRHRVEHPKHVLLHRDRLVDVLDELVSQLLCGHVVLLRSSAWD